MGDAVIEAEPPNWNEIWKQAIELMKRTRDLRVIGDFALANLDRTEHFYWLVLILMLAVFLLLRRVLGSTFGRALVGIKVNEHRMQALGFPVFRYKLASYVLAGALGGLSGYLAAVQFGFVNPEILSWHQSGG